MIDLNFLHSNSNEVIKALKRKDPSWDGELFLKLSKEIRAMRIELDALRKERNDISQVSKGGISQEAHQRSIEIGKNIKEKEDIFASKESIFQPLYLSIPNIPLSEIPDGGKESNKIVKEWKQKPNFEFDPLHHVDLGEKNGWFDFKKAAKMTGSNFALYKNDAVKLIYALGMYMLKNNMKHGFDPVLPPFLLQEKALINTGNFPKFKDQAYSIDGDGLFLTPTAEVNIANMYADHIFEIEDLPLRLTAFTSCFRREAGTYGSTERGLIRIHQFEKAEIYSFCEPEKSAQELDFMVDCAEQILKDLGLHYRISLLAAQDCSFSSAKTYDLEVWLPGQKQYYEVSSASNCTDFQARRALIRYKKDGKNQLVHTLNASSLALPRLIVAIMETYQQSNGSIEIPSILKKEGIF
jgi:seryl-tRNA synthetase